MGGIRCRISFFFTRSFSKRERIHPPNEFLCPISNSLMYDPAILASGHTIERVWVDVCRNLGFQPLLPDGSTPDFSTAIPNLALKYAIVNWCSRSGIAHPKPPLCSDIESIVRSLRESKNEEKIAKVRDSERELLNRASDNPRIELSQANSALERRNSYDYSSSDESEESVIANTTNHMLPFETRPSCLSQSSSDSSENYYSASASMSPSEDEDEDIVTQMNSLDVYEQEQAVIRLRKTTRINEESRTFLCTDRLLTALKQLLNSRFAAVQTNAAAATVNLSLAQGNKIKMVRAGIVPPLIAILRSGCDESRDHAAGAIFSLAIQDENKMAIGILGALPPLLYFLRSGSRPCRRDAALALYHLTLIQSNRVKILKLGSAAVLLGLLKENDVADAVVLVVCNLAVCSEGRAALLDANAVECLLGILRNRGESYSEMTRENCVLALNSLSHGNSRFRAAARSSGAVEVLREVAETGSERMREKARQILMGLRMRRFTVAMEEADWEAVMKSGVESFKYRVGSSHGRNSTEF